MPREIVLPVVVGIAAALLMLLAGLTSGAIGTGLVAALICHVALD